MTIINVKYDELDEVLEKNYENEELIDEAPYEIDLGDGDEALVTVDSPFYRVTDKDLIVAEGTYLRRENGSYEPDFSLSVVYENVPDEEFDPSKWLYWEQDPPTTAIHNYLNTI